MAEGENYIPPEARGAERFSANDSDIDSMINNLDSQMSALEGDDKERATKEMEDDLGIVTEASEKN